MPIFATIGLAVAAAVVERDALQEIAGVGKDTLVLEADAVGGGHAKNLFWLKASARVRRAIWHR